MKRGAIVRRARTLTWAGTVAIGILARVHAATARAITFTFVGSIGIAHGATDVAALGRIGVRPPGGKGTLSAAYGALALATFLAARRAPDLAAKLLRGVSVWHFGSGDVAFARACGSRVHGGAESIARGAIPLCVAGTSRPSVAAAAFALGRAAVHLSNREFADALDVALPAMLLLATPERFGFAVYFGTWHAVRHTALLLERDIRLGSERERALRFAREAALNTLIATLAGVVAFGVEFLQRSATAPETNVTGRQHDDVFGALILAITVPHQIAVTLLEQHAARNYSAS